MLLSRESTMIVNHHWSSRLHWFVHLKIHRICLPRMTVVYSFRWVVVSFQFPSSYRSGTSQFNAQIASFVWSIHPIRIHNLVSWRHWISICFKYVRYRFEYISVLVHFPFVKPISLIPKITYVMSSPTSKVVSRDIPAKC